MADLHSKISSYPFVKVEAINIFGLFKKTKYKVELPAFFTILDEKRIILSKNLSFEYISNANHSFNCMSIKNIGTKYEKIAIGIARKNLYISDIYYYNTKHEIKDLTDEQKIKFLDAVQKLYDFVEKCPEEYLGQDILSYENL